jgi:4-amino-4-deoxy-L-arabinose transferase-like glycosyltransferase
VTSVAAPPGASLAAALSGERAGRLALAVIAATLIVRLALSASIGLSVDEAYAVTLARHPALSYFDHPPFAFWLAGATARLFGSEAPFVVRLPFVLLFAGTSLGLFLLTARLFGAASGLWSVVLVNLVPFFTLCAGGWVLPDGPLLCFGVAAAACLARATLSSEGRCLEPTRAGRGAWLGYGSFVGLALLSKYHAVFLLLGAGLFLLTTPARRWLRRPEPYLAAGLALLLFTPVLVWNARHQWASFRFQGGRAVPQPAGASSPLLDSLAGQAAWMLPWIFLPLLGVLAGALRRGPRDPRRWLLACLALGPIGVFTGFALLGSRGLPHWEAPGYFMLLPALGAGVASRLARGDRATRLWLAGSLLATPLLLLVLLVQVRTGFVEALFPRLAFRGDPTDDLVPWAELLPKLASWGFPRPGVVVAGVSWADAAKLAHALGPEVPVTCVGADARGFRYDAAAPQAVGADVLLFARRTPRLREPLAAYAPDFQRIESVGNVTLHRGSEPAVEVSVYLGHHLLHPIPAQGRL